jgi:hypothetical protein
MAVHLWHFTHSADIARKIEAEGFLDRSSVEYGPRCPCFSLPGERYWEGTWGPALVEMWLDIDEQKLNDRSYYYRGPWPGEPGPPYYQIPTEVVNVCTVKRRSHANADHLPRSSEAYPKDI